MVQRIHSFDLLPKLNISDSNLIFSLTQTHDFDLLFEVLILVIFWLGTGRHSTLGNKTIVGHYIIIFFRNSSCLQTAISTLRVPLRSRHFLSQKLWHFHKNIRSCVENEFCCQRTVNISNVNFTSKISIPPESVFKNMGQQIVWPW